VAGVAYSAGFGCAGRGSHWWDGSQLYGSTADYRAKMRTEMDGKIFVGKDHLVHPDPTALVQMQSAALAGWWVGLELFYTLFSLEHNSICDKLKQEYPEWGMMTCLNTLGLSIR
jgi:hypothetical protein